MSSVKDELVEALNRHSYLTAKALDALLARTQLREAMRTPTDWRVSSVGLPGTTNDARQLCSRNPERAYVLVVNSGTKDALIGPINFDVAEAQSQYVEFKASASTTGCFLLKAGNTIKLESTGPVFVAPAVTGTAVRVEAIEYLYRVQANVLPIHSSDKKSADGGINLQSIKKELV